MKQDTIEIRGIVINKFEIPLFCAFMVGNQYCEYKGFPRPSIGDSVVVVGRRCDETYRNAFGQTKTYSILYANSVTIE